ncbi:DM13 domain-containing protein [Chryseobacterium profundimaris]|uniref:Electron transfer DM13 n=1 Tax=Chryseobacterium profundimaris TaxID=1387275 RepID=A0ABY1PDV4_9FLAO|nr:DM13 domain-containing protein [Chryseobacterium profundimaris]SMP30018.1 Electron transfer DM13 [Chryseobacterium profundimaris]
MKKLLLILIVGFFLQSCVRENTSTEDLMEMAPENSKLIYSGDFMMGPYGNNIGGKAEIYEKDGVYTLAFDKDFSVSNGPDLYLYLSTEQQPNNFISLGRLKSINGGQVYTFATKPDLDNYKYAVVHCQQYNHMFSYALLQKK